VVSFDSCSRAAGRDGHGERQRSRQMTDLIERTFHWFKEQPPGRVSRPGSYVAATAIWASRSDARCALPSTARDKKPNRERN